jgi:WD40 repeat protein
MANYKQTHLLEGHERAVSCLKFSPCGSWLGSCSADISIKLWDPFTGTLVRSFHVDGEHNAGSSPLRLCLFVIVFVMMWCCKCHTHRTRIASTVSSPTPVVLHICRLRRF